MDKESWVKHLAPVLNPDASEVYMGLDTGDQKDYTKVRDALFDHYSIDNSAYRRKMNENENQAKLGQCAVRDTRIWPGDGLEVALLSMKSWIN